MKTATIKSLLEDPQIGNEVIVMGWVRTFRSNRFIAINDGSTLQNLQCVIDFENTDEKLLKEINTGACLKLIGKLEESQGRGQKVEVKVESVCDYKLILIPYYILVYYLYIYRVM